MKQFNVVAAYTFTLHAEMMLVCYDHFQKVWLATAVQSSKHLVIVYAKLFSYRLAMCMDTPGF